MMQRKMWINNAVCKVKKVKEERMGEKVKQSLQKYCHVRGLLVKEDPKLKLGANYRSVSVFPPDGKPLFGIFIGTGHIGSC